MLAQTETNWECVLADDGSTDATPDIARKFAGQDDRICLVSGRHRGIVPTLNAGLARCSGRYVARMDADDWMHPDRLRLQRQALEAHPDWSAVGSHVEVFPRELLRSGRLEYEAWLNGIETPDQLRAEAFVECPIAHPTFFARREAMAAFGYHDRGWPEDYDLVLRWLGAGHVVGVVPRKLLRWRESAGSLSRTGPVYGTDRFTRCKAFYLQRQFLGTRRSYVLWGYGGTGRALRRALAELGSEPSHIVEVHPRRLGQVIHGAPVIRPEDLPGLVLDASPVRIIASVSGAKPRAQIRAALDGMEYREGRDYVCAA